MKFGFAIPAYGAGADGGAVAELIAAGEELGFDSAWLADHIAVPEYAAGNLPSPFLEPLATCAWALGTTRRLRFGTDVLVAPYRHPLLVSAMLGTLGRLGGDRIILGVGIGYLRGEFEILGAPYRDRARATEAWVEAVRTPPAGYSVVKAPEPAPIWIGGNSPQALRRAALLGDGWHPLWLPPEEYRQARQTILEIRLEQQIDRGFTFSFSAPRTAFATEPPGGWPAPAPRPPPGSEFRYAPAAWTTPGGRPGLVGSPDDVISDLHALADAGVEHITLRFGDNDPAHLERFARQVMPAFEARRGTLD
jgi:alkanesulfonate monooxygenase SsuD/methylene tetrahydromethanopterin reductase-like flavin-dependent oxidoreductase (luciferase family)